MPNHATNNSGSGKTNGSSHMMENQRQSLEKELETLNKEINGENTSSKTILKKSENELNLLEKRMILYLKLKSWNELIEEGYRILGKKGPIVIVYKSVLVGLCRVGRYDDEVSELLNHWKKASPKDMEMHDTNQKMLAYQNAIRSGVNPNDLFNNLEQALGLNEDWVSNRTAVSSDYYWRFRPPPKMQNTFYICPRATDNASGVNSCMYGDKCISAHSKEELEEWKQRQSSSSNKSSSQSEIETTPTAFSEISSLISKVKVAGSVTTQYTIAQPCLTYLKQYPSHAYHYLKDITKRINETKDLRTLLADQLVDVKFVCNTSLKITKSIPVGIGNGLIEFLATKWIFLIGSRQPVRTVCLLHDPHRDYFSISSAFFINSAGKNLNLIEIHETNKVQRGRLQVLNTFVPQNMIQVLGGWPEWFYYKIELTFSPPAIAYQLPSQIYGSFRQTIMFDFKSNPKLVKHMAVEVIPNKTPLGKLSSQFTAHSEYTSNQSEDLPNSNLPKLSPPVLPVQTESYKNSQHSTIILGDTAKDKPHTVVRQSSFDSDTVHSNIKKTTLSSEVIRLWNKDLFDLVDSEAGLAVGHVQHYKSCDGFRSGDSSESENSLDFVNNKDELTLTRENYILSMARLLSLEVKTHQDRLSKLNLTTSLELTANYTIERNSERFLKSSYGGQLFGRLELDSNVVDDLSLGHFILRNCSSVYLAPLDNLFGSRAKPRVYICKIADKLKSAIIISIGPRAVSELNLRTGSVMKFHIQFQLDTLHFRAMKSVLEGVGDVQLDLIFPRFGDRSQWVTFPKESIGLFYEGDLTLNIKQMEAYHAITYRRTREINSTIPPVIIIGAFGTGKTYTLAQCLKKLLLAPIFGGKSNRILICTNSNSGADIYIANFIHPWLKAEELRLETAKPLRIYFADGLVQSVSTTVRQYCLFTIDGQNFRYPTKEEVLRHSIVIVTLSTVMELIQLGLEEDTFSHIIIDEAAQCLETETIQPLILAGRHTCVVLAGDHMQLSPKILGALDITKPMSLIERLNSCYPLGHPCRIVLKENYRSHNAILKFAGERFYNSQLRCASIQPVHSVYFPLTFFSVTKGEECQSEDKTSYHNMAEVKEVTERIRSLLQTWPSQWESPTESSNAIVVLTPYPEQVLRIRSALRSKGFPFINVDRVLNVQGKQFKVVFISTVRTFRNSQGDMTKEENDFGFFNNAKMLNTAVTRAQSLVAVVGDPISLCTVGKCSKLWQDFIQTAFENKSFFGVTNADIRELNMKLKASSSQAPVPTVNVHSEPKDSFLGHGNFSSTGMGFNIQPVLSSPVQVPAPLVTESNFSPSPIPDSLKAVGAKITRPRTTSTIEDDFIDKILNTRSAATESHARSLSHLASIWDKKIDHEVDSDANGWNKAIASFGYPTQTAVAFSTFMPSPSCPISSSIWSTDPVSSPAHVSSSSSSLLRKPELNKPQNIPEHDNNGSNNLDGNFGLPKKLYYDKQNESSFDEVFDDNETTVSTLFSGSLMGNTSSGFSKTSEDSRSRKLSEESLITTTPTGFPVAVGSEQKHRPSAAANELYEQVKSLTSNSPVEQSSHFSQKDLFSSFSNITLESKPKSSESLYEHLATGNEVYFNTNTNSVTQSRKVFTYEVPPRMMKRVDAAVTHDNPFYGRHPKFPSAFSSTEINSILQQGSCNDIYANLAADVSAIDQQQMLNIKAVVGPNANNQKEHSSSASSTSSSIALEPNVHPVDDTEFPSLYEIESKSKGSSEWVEVKKSKKTTKTPNPPSDGQESTLTAEKKIEALQQMGFDKKKAIRALQNCDKDLERAVEYLLAGGGASCATNNNGTLVKIGSQKFPNL